MKPPRFPSAAALVAACLLAAPVSATVVRFETSLGVIDVRLYDTATPGYVANFLGYMGRGDWNNTMFHRSVPGFIIQGGGWTYDGSAQVEPDNFPRVFQDSPVANEPGISNLRGTIAMAKVPATTTDGVPIPGGGPDSATNQWFFNLGDNSANLDNQNGGFTVFGRVLRGMSTVDAIAALPRFAFQGAWTDAPMRNYTTAEYQSFTPVDGDNVVLVDRIRVLNFSPGDYNLDGFVDETDYNRWKSRYGLTTDAWADGNGDGVVDQADYVVWRDAFVAAGGTAISIPEPGAAAFAVLGLLGGTVRTPRRRCVAAA